jgi:hypothetical protein
MKASSPSPRKAKSNPGSKAPVVELTGVILEGEPTSLSQVVDVIPSNNSDIVMVQEVVMVQTAGTPVLNGAKAAGEAFLMPGSSLVLDGDIKGAAIHIAGAYVARAILGPIGWAYFAADSFSKSVGGKSLHQYFIPAKPGSAEV